MITASKPLNILPCQVNHSLVDSQKQIDICLECPLTDCVYIKPNALTEYRHTLIVKAIREDGLSIEAAAQRFLVSSATINRVLSHA